MANISVERLLLYLIALGPVVSCFRVARMWLRGGPITVGI